MRTANKNSHAKRRIGSQGFGTPRSTFQRWKILGHFDKRRKILLNGKCAMKREFSKSKTVRIHKIERTSPIHVLCREIVLNMFVKRAQG